MIHGMKITAKKFPIDKKSFSLLYFRKSGIS
jgi:hypothetical protein